MTEKQYQQRVKMLERVFYGYPMIPCPPHTPASTTSASAKPAVSSASGASTLSSISNKLFTSKTNFSSSSIKTAASADTASSDKDKEAKDVFPCDPKIVDNIIATYRGEFTFCPSFDDIDLIGQLMHAGFLPMAMQISKGDYCLTPKIHTERCVMFFSKVKVPKSLEKKSKKFTISIDKAFDGVIDGIHAQHGLNWFYPPLVEAFKKINERRENGCFNGKSYLHSIEVWHEDKLVAGEMGYICGSVYTSLSGFYNMDSAGMVQMITMAKFLESKGLMLWDLGMALKYKTEDLGAMVIPRKFFIDMQRRLRDTKKDFITLEKTNCRDILRLVKDKSEESTTSTSAATTSAIKVDAAKAKDAHADSKE